MKKFLLIMLTLSVIAFASCSNEDNIIELSENNETEVTDSALQIVQRNLEMSKLRTDIYDYNLATFTEHDTNTRSVKNFFKNLFKNPWKLVVTVAADALGGVFGGVAGGITASGIVGCAIAFEVKTFAIVPMPSSVGPRRILGVPGGNGSVRDSILYAEDVIFNNVVPSPSLKLCYANDSIGYYHNKILYGIFSDDEKLNDYLNKDKQEQAQAIVAEMKKVPYLRSTYGAALDNPTNVNNGIAIADAVMRLAEEAETEDEFFDGLANLGMTDANVIDVMREILNGLYNIDPADDSGEYYQDILDIVANSNLDADMKQKFADGIIIGQASNHLWKRTITEYETKESGIAQ